MFLPSHSSNCDGFPQLLFKKLLETIVRKLWFGTEHLLSSASAGRELWRHAHSQLKTSRPCAASHQFLRDLSLPYTSAPPYPVTLRVYGRYAKERTNCLSSFCSCGHLYHSFCLQSKECTLEIEGQMRWICYKCSSSSKAGKLSENPSEDKKGRVTSQVGLIHCSRDLCFSCQSARPGLRCQIPHISTLPDRNEMCGVSCSVVLSI